MKEKGKNSGEQATKSSKTSENRSSASNQATSSSDPALESRAEPPSVSVPTKRNPSTSAIANTSVP